jgi:pimeloyl-ACP methyl ester carboxylesterase
MQMSTYVLIHGSWHGGWCWQKVVPHLRQAGYSVFAPDLPGHGEDKTPLSAITPELVMQSITAILAMQQEPVILVGHSSGGMLITEAARRRPEKVKTLVYLSAFLLPPGVTPRVIAQEDHESLLQASLIIDEERRVSMVRHEAARELFYADCSAEDAAWATSLLVPEASKSRAKGEVAPQVITAEVDIEQIPRVYIECLQDRALGPAMQKKMYTELPCRKVYTLPTGHSPFISRPEQLAACLLDIYAGSRK